MADGLKYWSGGVPAASFENTGALNYWQNGVPYSNFQSGGYTLVASAGSFSLTGNSSSIKADRKLPASLGQFQLTGIDSRIASARKMTADVSSFSLSGINASLLFGRFFPTSNGVFILTGTVAGLLLARKLQPETGSFILTGLSAGFTVTLSPVLTGTIRDLNNNPITGFTVKLYDSSTDAVVDEVLCDSNGVYVFHNPGAGPFYARAYRVGSPDLAGTTDNNRVPS